MKHLRLYEEYTTTTNTTTKSLNLPGTGQPPSSGSGQTRIPLRPGYTPPPPTSGQKRGGSSGQPRVTPPTVTVKPTDNNLIEVYFYPDKEQQKEVIRWGWINLKEFDEGVEADKDRNPHILSRASGSLYFTKQDAKNSNLGQSYGKIVFNDHAAKVGGGGEKVDGVFHFIEYHEFSRKKDDLKKDAELLNLYNIDFWNFIRDRYFEKNASGRWVRKISPGGFTDNSSVDIPDKFA